MSTIEQSTVLVNFQVTADEALALAQFLKRATWHEHRGCAVNDDEAYDIRRACNEVRDALARAGFNPR
jgi:hypothetical protein